MTRDPLDLSTAQRTIREKVVSLAARRGVDASTLTDTEEIPASGALDSASVLELIMWFEMTFDRTIPQSDLTVENFGTIEAMVRYLQGGRRPSA
jgi:acyl carrier protein